MFTDDLTTFHLLVLFLHLAVFGLALVVVAGYELVRKIYPFLHRFFRDHLFTHRAAQRVTEIRAIGAQARSEMQQLYHEYIYWQARPRNTQGDRS